MSAKPTFEAALAVVTRTILLLVTAGIILFFLFKFTNSWLFSETFTHTKPFSAVYTQYFSETLILLVLIITFFSWWFLSERFIFKEKFLIIFLFVFFFCTVNMVSTTQLITMFMFFEFIFFPSLFFAYSLSYSKKAEKTIEYLVIWTLAGAMIAFFGFGVLFFTTGTLNLIYTNSFFFTNTELNFLFFLFFLGFGIKVPLWPFYYWLTKVHVEAPTGFSMFLSGFLVKTAFFCFSQLFYFLHTKENFNFAVAVVLWGICDASSRMWSLLDIKRLIALATVQEMNMIMLFLFFLSNSNYTILNSFLLIHGLLSVFLFFLVDVVYKQMQTRNTTVLGGLNISSSNTLLFIWFAILIYRGFPIFSKFFVEWELMGALAQNFVGFGVLVMILFSMMGSGSFFKHWASAAYSSAENVVLLQVLNQKDFFIGLTAVVSLFAINFVFFLF